MSAVDDALPAAGRLLELAVADLALIDRLRLPLGEGLNVLTGETGAGKSLLIDALGLALGARADTTLVRHGADAARVDAVFARAGSPLLVGREVSAAGRSSARLDDETVTAGRLAAVAGRLVEIHGQHDQLRLLDEDHQRDLLDAFGGLGEARGAMAAAVARWQENRARLAELVADPREVLRRLELLDHEAQEIADARLRQGEAAEIAGDLAAAGNRETIAAGAVAARDLLAGDGRSARDRLAQATRELRGLARLDGRWEPLAVRLAGLEAEVEDVAQEVRALGDGVEHDPAALARLEDRLGEIHRLLRRYGDDEASVIAHAEQAAAEALRLRGMEGEREARKTDDQRLLGEVGDAGAALTGLRRAAAGVLAHETSAVLADIGFPADAFGISVERRAAAGEWSVIVDGDAVGFDAAGLDSIVFTFRPNAGEPRRPLAKIASGGELSRVGLAVQQVLARVDRTPTLVFDEIDSGIGGRSADPVGRSLWTLARTHQVLCVTHLPQIAAYADAHYRIAKSEREGRTVTDVVLLDDAGREAELAAMLGGAADGDAARLSARELLERARGWASTRHGVDASPRQG